VRGWLGWRNISITRFDPCPKIGPTLGERNRLSSSTKSYNPDGATLSSHLRNGEKLQSGHARESNGMVISVNSFVIALVGTGWKSVGGQLLAKPPKLGESKMPRKLRKSFVGHPSAILFLQISGAGVFQQQRLLATVNFLGCLCCR
jgi:hypothetical protein